VWFVQKKESELWTGTKDREINKNRYMEKRILGIILSILGIAGLIIAAIDLINGGEGMKHIKSLAVFGILGAVFFFAGISLVRSTNDRAT
jgi:small-conductance mechanosensitive channel